MARKHGSGSRLAFALIVLVVIGLVLFGLMRLAEHLPWSGFG